MRFLSVLAVLALFALPIYSMMVPIRRFGEVIEGSYIAVFNEEIDFELVKDYSIQYNVNTLNIGKFKAIYGKFSEEAINKLRQRPDLFKFIEADQIVRTLASQKGATWGIDRIDQRNLPLDTVYNYFDNAGENVDVYVIDTGILNTHTDFEGRAVSGYDFHNNKQDATDDNGHGTHCAGTIAGKTWGVAKKARLIGVKTLGRLGAGNLANVAKGVEFAAQQHVSKPNARSVASMSLGGPATDVLDLAVESAIEMGLIVVAASGNSDADACSTSPARVPTVITVNAADKNDTRATFSNYGSCTHIFAPGVDITSTWIGSNTATRTISGTSMACPHVSGAVAVLLSQYGSLTPAEAKKLILSNATPNKISDVKGSPNLNLYSPYAF